MTRSLLLRALVRHGYNVTQTALALGVTRQYVYTLLNRYALRIRKRSDGI